MTVILRKTLETVQIKANRNPTRILVRGGGSGGGGGAVSSVNGQTGVVVLDAGDIANTPAGNIAATTLQAAIDELDSEKQAADADLTAIAALAPSNDDVIQRKAGSWVSRTMAQLIADLAALGTTFQPLLATLTSWGAITRASGFDTFVASPTWTNFLSLVTGEPTFYTSGGTDVALADGGTGASLTDPNADRIMFWDDSAGAVTWLVPGTGITISGTSLDLDADLQSWAGVTRASGFDTFAATPSSANLRSLLTDETGSGAAVFGTSPTITTPALTDPVLTGCAQEDVYTITDGAAFEIDPSNGTIQTVTLGASRTPAATNFQSGEWVLLRVADGTAYTITWTTIGVVWLGGSAPTLATSGYSHILLWKVGSTVYGIHCGDSAT